jgi:fumarate reductase subunit D
MKKLQKMTSYILATVMVLLVSQFSVFAAGETANNSSSLTAGQIIGGLAVLLLVILVPLMRGGKRVTTK